jgi:two-component system, NarL family, response regulator LiaR
VSVRVVIADDHAVVRQGLRVFLDLDPDLEVVGEAADGAEAVRLVGELNPDVVVMDRMLPILDGLAATRAIRQSFPEVAVLVLTGFLDQATVVGALQAGAIGCLPKDTRSADLRQAVKSAAKGMVQLPALAAQMLVNMVRATADPAVLSDREKAVLNLVACGHSNKEIARELSISEGTAKTHVRSILSKLNLQSRTQAALYAVNARLTQVA